MYHLVNLKNKMPNETSPIPWNQRKYATMGKFMYTLWNTLALSTNMVITHRLLTIAPIYLLSQNPVPIRTGPRFFSFLTMIIFKSCIETIQDGLGRTPFCIPSLWYAFFSTSIWHTLSGNRILMKTSGDIWKI